MVKVSVIVPVYNGEKTVRACIDSLLGQTLEDMEIIVVNDGSTDRTGEVLKEYSDKITIINQKNSGQGIARNSGIDAARGEYIGFTDADDTVDADMYLHMYTAAKNGGFDVVQCGINDITEDGKENKRACFDETVEINSRADYVYDYLYRNKHTYEICNKLIKKSFLDENNLRFGDSRKYFAEDLKLNCEIILYLDKIKFLGGCYYNYHIRSSGYYFSDMLGRIQKTITLFDEFLNNEMDSDTEKSFECVAALIILLYCRAAAKIDLEHTIKTVQNKKLKKYVKTSMRYRSDFKHFWLYFLIYYSPPKLCLFILHIFLKY